MDCKGSGGLSSKKVLCLNPAEESRMSAECLVRVLSASECVVLSENVTFVSLVRKVPLANR